MNPLAIEDEMLWQERYYLALDLLPKFIEQEIALKILTIGKAINFLRRLCGDSEWIMGPMAKVSKPRDSIKSSVCASCFVSASFERVFPVEEDTLPTTLCNVCLSSAHQKHFLQRRKVVPSCLRLSPSRSLYF